MLQLKSSLTLALSLPLIAVSSLEATVYVSDNFTNSVGTNVDVLPDTEAVGVGSYENILTNFGLSALTVSGFGDGQVMSMGGATTYRAFNGAATFSLDSMAVNETLSLTFDLQFDFDPSEALSWNFGSSMLMAATIRSPM